MFTRDARSPGWCAGEDWVGALWSSSGESVNERLMLSRDSISQESLRELGCRQLPKGPAPTLLRGLLDSVCI